MYQSFTAQLSKCYNNPDIVKLINNQLLQLTYLPEVKCLSKFAILKFQVPNITEQYRYITDNHYIEFYFVLGKGYPLIAPRVHVKDKLLLPGINDCRDLLYTIIEVQYWNYQITLKKIQNDIGSFLTRLYKSSLKNNNIYDIARFGNFNLNSIYPMELIKELRGQHIFYALEFMQDDDFKMIVLDVSATHLTIFTTKQQPHYQNGSIKVPQEKDITYCMLAFYGELGSIAEICADRRNFTDIYITFSPRKSYYTGETTGEKTKKIKIKKGLIFLDQLMKGIKYYTPEMKVTLDMEKIGEQQRFILTQIQKAQQTIQHHLNIYTIRHLVDKYQEAVDFYSAENVPYYEAYLDKISRLYMKPEIKVIMGMEDSPNMQKKKVRLNSI